jgi:hypothetical protein
LSVVIRCTCYFNLSNYSTHSFLKFLHSLSEDAVLYIEVFIEGRFLALLVFQTRKLVWKRFDFDRELVLVLLKDTLDVVLVLVELLKGEFLGLP